MPAASVMLVAVAVQLTSGAAPVRLAGTVMVSISAISTWMLLAIWSALVSGSTSWRVRIAPLAAAVTATVQLSPASNREVPAEKVSVTPRLPITTGTPVVTV